MPTLTVRKATHKKLERIKRHTGVSFSQFIDRSADRELREIHSKQASDSTEGRAGTDAPSSSPAKS